MRPLIVFSDVISDVVELRALTLRSARSFPFGTVALIYRRDAGHPARRDNRHSQPAPS